MNQKRKIRRFTAYKAESLLYFLHLRGYWTCDSQFFGVGYAVKDKTLIIAGGKNGNLSIGFNEIDDFILELAEVAQLVKEKGIRGNVSA